MALSAGEDRSTYSQAMPSPRRVSPRRRSFFTDTPATDAATNADADADTPEERHVWDRQEMLERGIARRAYDLTHGERPLPAIDADGHVIVPPETLARQAAEAAEAEAQRLSDLATTRLDALQTRRWVEWLARYEQARPDTLLVSLGPRGESEARTFLRPYRFEDTDERHPDGPTIAVSGVTMRGEPPQGHSAPVRAFPNERVLDAIRQQYLEAMWRDEWAHPRGPHPGVATALAHWQEEERKRDEARRSGYGGYKGSGVTW